MEKIYSREMVEMLFSIDTRHSTFYPEHTMIRDLLFPFYSPLVMSDIFVPCLESSPLTVHDSLILSTCAVVVVAIFFLLMQQPSVLFRIRNVWLVFWMASGFRCSTKLQQLSNLKWILQYYITMKGKLS